MQQQQENLRLDLRSTLQVLKQRTKNLSVQKYYGIWS